MEKDRFIFLPENLLLQVTMEKTQQQIVPYLLIKMNLHLIGMKQIAHIKQMV